ncbi:GNAT family N-acetyltransferase [Microbulbifer sp. SSSA005]|uniref:GNAT family N-acetyltransferase n=1 Tax=unclassified Microbulbifer TaxID=2619833 RepID=UPI004039BAB5
MNIKIRHLEESDNKDLFEIHSFASVNENTSQLLFLSSDKVANLFSDPNNYTLVAELDTKVVGYVTLFLINKIRDRHSAVLAIAVHPEFHGRGVGRMLMEEALNQADNWLNLIRLELEVHVDNGTAIALYEGSGFQVEGTKRLGRFKAGRYIDVLLMARIHPEYQAKA